MFVEETSLVARPAVGFPELKERLYARLEHMGIEVRARAARPDTEYTRWQLSHEGMI